MTSVALPRPPTRTWGDGLSRTRVREHLIEAIEYGAHESWLRGRDGETLRATSPGALASLWEAHGGKVFAFTAEDRHWMSATQTPLSERTQQAVAALVAIGLRCTCATTPITDCPNYMPGDEEETDDD